jgi:hypothetical protein
MTKHKTKKTPARKRRNVVKQYVIDKACPDCGYPDNGHNDLDSPIKTDASFAALNAKATDDPIPKLDIKVVPSYMSKSNVLGEPDFEPVTVSYPANWWEGFKQSWLPWTTPDLITLDLYRRVPGAHIAISG